MHKESALSQIDVTYGLFTGRRDRQSQQFRYVFMNSTIFFPTWPLSLKRSRFQSIFDLLIKLVDAFMHLVPVHVISALLFLKSITNFVSDSL
jgi:hypothetical protein